MPRWYEDNEMFCPSCGQWVPNLHFNGWCGYCTAAYLGPGYVALKCPSCNRVRVNKGTHKGSHIKCSTCRQLTYKKTRIIHALRHLEHAGERLDPLVDQDEDLALELRDILEDITDAYFKLKRLCDD